MENTIFEISLKIEEFKNKLVKQPNPLQCFEYVNKYGEINVEQLYKAYDLVFDTNHKNYY